MQKVRVEKQVVENLNQRNRPEPMVSIIHDLPLDLNVLIWQKNNAGHNGK